MQPQRRTLLVGDGASDFCVSGVVDLVFAKSRLIDHCLVNAIPHHPIASFADALPLLGELAREPVELASAEFLSTSP
jgi:2-hydroxy-3-keto-5-methylthiopentenyl-1-phosphate phosphatase